MHTCSSTGSEQRSQARGILAALALQYLLGIPGDARPRISSLQVSESLLFHLLRTPMHGAPRACNMWGAWLASMGRSVRRPPLLHSGKTTRQ